MLIKILKLTLRLVLQTQRMSQGVNPKEIRVMMISKHLRQVTQNSKQSKIGIQTGQIKEATVQVTIIISEVHKQQNAL
mgnify:CR=1 FL=1